MVRKFPTAIDVIREDAQGVLRIANTRVLLDLVVQAYLRGDSCELIAENYSTLSLADVYATIAFYLRHRERVDAYLAEREAEASALRKLIEAEQLPASEVRQRLEARRAARLAEQSNDSRS